MIARILVALVVFVLGCSDGESVTVRSECSATVSAEASAGCEVKIGGNPIVIKPACNGCVDVSGRCVSGIESLACGRDGQACDVCSANEVCSAESGACSAAPEPLDCDGETVECGSAGVCAGPACCEDCIGIDGSCTACASAETECKSFYDCPPLASPCIFNACVDGQCVHLNLKDPGVTRPIDPVSGQPVGQGCAN